jgi:microcompartment protein CcmK/EutM
MTKRARKDVEAAKLLQQILVDAEGDDAQLWALADFIGAGSGDRPVT